MSLLGGFVETGVQRKGHPPHAAARSFDAAATDRHNENHWLWANAGNADSAIREGLSVLRNRCRYEVRNNSYAEGIIDTLVNEVISTGADLQFQSGEGPDANKEIEEKFYLWSLICDIEGKLSFGEIQQIAGVRQQCDSGEGLIVMVNARSKKKWTRVRREPQLRLRAIEPDRLDSPLGLVLDDKIRDGIEYDGDGKPAFYYILKQHPGSSLFSKNFGEYDKVPASQVMHLYRLKRFEQSRGIPWITPALPLFALLRRYTLATCDAAEMAANVAGVLKTEATDDSSVEYEAGDEVEIPRNSWLTVPGGEMQQMKPEHPSTTYKMFKAEIINEIARCISMPYNIAAANSSEYNYASGRLDHQSFNKFKRTVRGWIELKLNNPVLFAWLREALLIPGYFKYYKGKNLAATIPSWNWPDSGHVDPQKEAKGQDLRLKNVATNLKTEYSLQGKDWQPEMLQRAVEIKTAIEQANEIKKETGIDIDWRILAGVKTSSAENDKQDGENENADDTKSD